MFPARAGMNRFSRQVGCRLLCVPRPRGDEPEREPLPEGLAMCSPPARG